MKKLVKKLLFNKYLGNLPFFISNEFIDSSESICILLIILRLWKYRF